MGLSGLTFGGEGRGTKMIGIKRNRTWTLYVACVVLFHWHPTMTAAQDCIATVPNPGPFSETDAAGLELLKINAKPTERWTFRIKSPSPLLEDYFILKRNQLTNVVSLELSKTLDLEGVANLVVSNGYLNNAILFEFTCASGSPQAESKVEFDRYITVLSVNEFAPQFVNVPPNGFNISEATPLNQPTIVLKDYVKDEDLNPNHPGYDFELMPMTDPARDGRSNFAIGDILTGSLIITKALDYESMEPAEAYYLLNVSFGDRQGKTSTGTIRINVIDADDQSPEFWYPGCPEPCFSAYSATIEADFQGEITRLNPAPIGARDLDTMNSPIKYNFKQGDPDYFDQYLAIDEKTGAVSVIKPVADTDTAAFFIVLQAVEDTVLQNSEQTTLMITVSGRNFSSPTQPPFDGNGYGSAESAYRLATIVLGILFGLVLIALVLFVVCSVAIDRNRLQSIPVLPRAIGKLSSDGTPAGDITPPPRSSSPGRVSSSNDMENPGYGSTTRRKMSSDSGVDILRSLSSPVSSVPPKKAATQTTSGSSAASEPARPTPSLSSFASPAAAVRPDSSYSDRDLDLDLLGERNEIDLHNRRGTGDRGSRLSTISGSELVPYGDRMGLVGREEGMGRASPTFSDGGAAAGLGGRQDRVGMSNPAYVDDGEMMEVKDSDSDNDIDFGVVPIQEAHVMI